MTAPTVPTPHDPSRQSDRRSKSSSSARKPVSRPPASVSKLPARWSESLAMRLFGPPEPRRITRQTLTGNAPASSRSRAGTNRVSTPAQTLYDGGGANRDRQRLRTGMTGRTSLTIVLAAGEGTRMRSSLPKVLHPVAGQPLLAHVLGAVPKGAGAALAVVIGPDHESVATEAK